MTKSKHISRKEQPRFPSTRSTTRNRHSNFPIARHSLALQIGQRGIV
jgi:hypothetical protein